VRDVTERVEAYHLLEGRVAERTAELSALLAISHDIAGTLDQRRLLDLVLAGLQTITHYRGAVLLLLEGDEATVAACNMPPDTATPRGRRFPLTREGEVWARLGHREAVLIAEQGEDSPMTRDFLALLGAHLDADPRAARSWLAVPLAHEERLIGLLVLDAARPHHFTPRHAELAQTIANQAAVALENARLYAQAQGLAALEERQRLARELHDSVVQALYGVTLSTEAATRLLAAGDTALTATYLREIRETAEDALKEMRLLIFELRPPILEREGLVAALQARLDTVEGRAGGLEATLDVHGTAPLPPAIEEVFYRVAQEALNNVLKHARARRVTVTLERDGPLARLLVADDGVGFDAHDDGPRRGLGLRGMAERAAQVGGSLGVESTPGRGTLVRLEVPR
jgi:signal transduction histidine kinase